MATTELVSSHPKAFFGFVVVSLAFFCGFLFRNEMGDLFFWSNALFTGVFTVLALWIMIRPHRLRLDDDGFTLSGGLHWSPMRVAWRDVEKFVAKTYGTRWVQIGIRFRPRVKRSWLSGWLDIDDSLPGGWDLSDAEMVDYLNEHRIIAMNRMAKCD